MGKSKRQPSVFVIRKFKPSGIYKVNPDTNDNLKYLDERCADCWHTRGEHLSEIEKCPDQEYDE